MTTSFGDATQSRLIIYLFVLRPTDDNFLCKVTVDIGSNGSEAYQEIYNKISGSIVNGRINDLTVDPQMFTLRNFTG
jgi:hypothetical protein